MKLHGDGVDSTKDTDPTKTRDEIQEVIFVVYDGNDILFDTGLWADNGVMLPKNEEVSLPDSLRAPIRFTYPFKNTCYFEMYLLEVDTLETSPVANAADKTTKYVVPKT